MLTGTYLELVVTGATSQDAITWLQRILDEMAATPKPVEDVPLSAPKQERTKGMARNSWIKNRDENEADLTAYVKARALGVTREEAVQQTLGKRSARTYERWIEQLPTQNPILYGQLKMYLDQIDARKWTNKAK